MTLSRVYGFGKYMTHFDRDGTRGDVQRLHGLTLRPRVAAAMEYREAR